MSTSGKKRKHGEKMKRKRAAKAARRDAYKALAGTSAKSKRLRRNKSVEPSGRKHEHLMANCGNIGCKQCFPFTVQNPETELILLR
jgi:hypothetical protein